MSHVLIITGYQFSTETVCQKWIFPKHIKVLIRIKIFSLIMPVTDRYFYRYIISEIDRIKRHFK